MTKPQTVKRLERLKVNVSPAEKEELMQRAFASQRSLSEYLRHVGLGHRAGASAERVLQVVDLLEYLRVSFDQIAEMCDDDACDGLLILMRLEQIQQYILMLAPVDFNARDRVC